MSEKKPKPEYITGLARGLEVIRSFDRSTPEMTLSEVALKTGLAPATARRCLFTLESLGFVRRTGRRFVLSPRILSLGAAYLSSMNIKEIVQPILDDLRETFNDAASLTILDGTHVVYVAHAPSKREVRLRQSVGSRLPAHATSTGHVLLAFQEDKGRAAYLKEAPLPGFTAKTPTTADEIREIFKQVRAQDYALVIDTLEYGSIALAVPVRDNKGRVVAAINCSSDRTRSDAETMIATRLPRLKQASDQLAAALERFPALVHSVAD